MYLKIDPNVKSLKLVSKEKLTEFMKWFLLESSAKLGKYCDIKNFDSHHIAVIDVTSKKEAESLLSKLSMSSFTYLNKFIENDLKEDPKDYARNMVLFESEVGDNRLLMKF
jgi:hypothetical protein